MKHHKSGQSGRYWDLDDTLALESRCFHYHLILLHTCALLLLISIEAERWFCLVYTGCRLGFYEWIRDNVLGKNTDGTYSLWLEIINYFLRNIQGVSLGAGKTLLGALTWTNNYIIIYKILKKCNKI